MNNLYLFGEDFEAILDILEGDEDLEKQFESSVSDAQIQKIFTSVSAGA